MGGHSAQTLRHVAILHILHGTDAVKSLTYLKFGSNPTCYQLRPRKSFLVPMASRHLFTTTVDINIQRYPWFSWCHGQCPLLSAPGAAPQMPQTCDRSCISFSLDVSDGDMMFNLMSSFFRTASTPEICVAMEQKEKLRHVTDKNKQDMPSSFRMIQGCSKHVVCVQEVLQIDWFQWSSTVHSAFEVTLPCDCKVPYCHQCHCTQRVLWPGSGENWLSRKHNSK